MINRTHILLLLLMLFVNSCIEPYVAEIDEEKTLFTIEGSLIRGEEVQTIRVGTTSPLLDPRPRPVQHCQVKVADDQNNEFLFVETDPGTYILRTSDNQLKYGHHYRLSVTTPDGDLYESDHELLNPEAAVDSVYYAIEEKLDATTGQDLQGIQYYIDIRATDDLPRYFRWNLEESYEYTSTGPISYFYYSARLEPIPPGNPWLLHRCWITGKVPELYLSNTINLTTNEKKRIPLHYVSTETDRMKIKYSLLVKQYTLNERAYEYWQQNLRATQESGGLYTGQPDQPITNLYNVNDRTEKVVGFFWVSAMTKKRIVVPRPHELFVPDEKCFLYEFDPVGPHQFPIYIRLDEETGMELTGSPYCFDCRERGGSLIPPEFWE